jgi:hypothetical protein
LEVWKVRLGRYTSWNGLETIPNNAPCSSPRYWYLADPSADESGPRMDTHGGIRTFSSRKMHPSDSTVGIRRDMHQNDRLDLLGNGSDARSGTPNVPTKSVAHPSLENASQLIPMSEYDEELGKICTFPSSQMGRREISEFSLDGISRLKTL